MRLTKIAMLALAAVALTAVSAPGTAVAAPADAAPQTYSYKFADGAQGWVADFADYSATAEDMELKAGIAPLPAGTENSTGFSIQGNNHSDDLYMFLKRRLGPADGIVPNRTYTVQTAVSFWSNVGIGCFGVGGSEGGSVYVKAGASTQEPTLITDAMGYYRVVIDKGDQAVGGPDGAVLGNIETDRECGDKTWVKVNHASTETLTVTADATGHLWLNVGTDSGYEEVTHLYYSSVTTTLTPN